MHRIGELEFAVLHDGTVWVDAGGPFGLVPRNLFERHITPTAENLIPMVLNCLLVRSQGKIILIDTGLGNKLSEDAALQWGLEREGGGLIGDLASLGVAPDDVDIVINTHLHADHCAGNTGLIDGEMRPVFPRAEYWVQRIEWAEASHPDARTRGTYFKQNFAPLLTQGRLKLLHGDTRVTDGVHCVVTPGHTRGHQSVLLQDGDWHGLFVADMASYGVQMARTSWLTAYDVYPLENIRTKQRWQRWALEKEAWLFFQHDPQITIARLVEEDGRKRLAPICLD
ncbi:MAG: MBL fold metallo-hydrolase [Anaerolineales bacterium]|nr:MBL fold metallo-hydrolase [Anaerolineales bacterium]